MPKTFHILPSDAQYTFATELMLNGSTEHRYIIMSACGVVLIRFESEYCNVVIADPGWDRDWCADCVRAFYWPEPIRTEWADQHGIMNLLEATTIVE